MKLTEEDIAKIQDHIRSHNGKCGLHFTYDDGSEDDFKVEIRDYSFRKFNIHDHFICTDYLRQSDIPKVKKCFVTLRKLLTSIIDQ